MDEGCSDIEPKRAHHDDAGFDLKSKVDYVLEVGERNVIGTGLHLEIESGFEAQVRPRSGLAAKHGITVLNSPGTIDAQYRGEVGVILLNTSKEDFEIKRGDRIAQLVINELPGVSFVRVESLSTTERGDGGFGSTGKE